MTVANDFWRSSGYFLLDRGEDGRLCVTRDFVRAFLQRPEMQLVQESCQAEHVLHTALVDDPYAEVAPDRIAAIEDPDVRENYRIVLRFRDRMLAAGSIEAFYLDVFRRRTVDIPPLFLDQVVHVILRSILDGNDDAMYLRAAELLFRTQKASINQGAILLADEEVVEQHAQQTNPASLAQLLTRPVPSTVELDVLDENNKSIYFERSDQFDTVLDITFGRTGLDALCRVLEAWIAHFLAVDVTIQPVQSVRDERWVWHVGLDPQSSEILNDLYNGVEVDEDRLGRILSLFRLELSDPSVMISRIAGRPVYLGLAMDSDNLVRFKPQNLLISLPLGRPS